MVYAWFLMIDSLMLRANVFHELQPMVGLSCAFADDERADTAMAVAKARCFDLA